MSFRKPVQKTRDLVRRFGVLEGRVAGLADGQDHLAARQDDLVAQLTRQAEEQRDQIASLLAEVRTMTEELRDSVHLAAARSTLGRARTRVLFLVHHIEAWDSYDALFRAMEAAADFEPVVASMPRHFRGMDGLGYEDEVHRQLTARAVPHLRLTDPDEARVLRLVKAVDPDLVFRQSQWDPDVPGYAATDRLTFARLCLVPYETMNLVENVPQDGRGSTAVDSAYHRAAWAVFCANDLVKEMAEQDGSRGGAQFVVTGHPKADRLRGAAPRWPLHRPAGPAARHRVVWSAHHSAGTGWSDFGAFHLMAEQMLAWAAEEPGTDFVLMPHPALLPFLHCPDSPWTGAQLAQWRTRWEALPNAVVFTEGDYAPLLQAADLVVTDGLSMLVEPQVVGTPVVFFERPGHRPFNRIGELVRTGVHTVTSVPEARTVAAELLDSHMDPLAARQAAIVQRLFGPPGSADRVLTALRGKIAEERGHVSSALDVTAAAEAGVPAPRPVAALERGLLLGLGAPMTGSRRARPDGVPGRSPLPAPESRR